jgi:hypothetical protein
MRKTQPGRKCFAAFEFNDAPRTAVDHARCRTSHNFFMQRLNPPRTDRRSMLAALKPFDLLYFLTAPKR